MIIIISNLNCVFVSTVSTLAVILLFRNSHQQTACSGLQEPEPVQALQAGTQTGRLWQCECSFDSDYSHFSLIFGRACLVWCWLTLDASSSVSMCEQIESGSVWKQVYQDLGIPVLNSAAGYNVKCAYRKYVQALPPQLLKAFHSVGQMQLCFCSFSPRLTCNLLSLFFNVYFGCLIFFFSQLLYNK